MTQCATRRAEMIPVYDDNAGRWYIDARRHTTTLISARWWCRRHTTTNDNGRRRRWLISAAGSYYCNFVNPDLSTEPYLFCQLSLPKAQINTRLYTAYWSRGVTEYDGKRRMSSTSTSVFYPLPHP